MNRKKRKRNRTDGYRARKAAKKTEKRKRQRANLEDYYIRKILRKQGETADSITAEMIEQKRQSIKSKRLKRSIK